METSPPAPTHGPVSDDMNKHGDGTQAGAAQKEDLALPMKPNEGGGVMDIAAEGTAVTLKKRKNWGQKDTDDLLGAVFNTKKVCIRMEQGAARGSYWDSVAEAVPGRTGYECQGRMDTLKKSFRKINKYCDEQGKEFEHLNEDDFGKLKGSPPLTEEWYSWLSRHQKKSNGAGSSSKSSVPASDSSTLGLEPPVLPDGTDQGEAAMDPPGSQVELPVPDPIQRAPPAAPPCSDFMGDLDELSVSDPNHPIHQQAPPASPHWSDRIEDFLVISVPIEQAIATPPFPRYEVIEELDHEAWN